MIYPEDDIYIEIRPSCTIDEAVAKMIGWLQGTRRQRFIQLTADGEISADQLPAMHSLQGSLQERLTALRQAASSAILDAANGDATVTEIQEKEEYVSQIDSLIDRAAFYLREIHAELDEGGSSALKIDQHETDRTGDIHIRLKSLDAWAYSNYGINVLPAAPIHSTKAGASDANAWTPDDAPDLTGKLGKNSANSLYTSFAFLIEAFAEIAATRYQVNGKPNSNAIAKHLAELASKASGGNIYGQDTDSIRKRISLAMKIKGDKLRGWN